ncbi:MAG: terminase small subunit [Immundisolibacteraceae bacterium]|nr:terminase small subunit [Immundisolibacteraceae bacterium]
MNKPKLTAKQKMFCEEYLIDLNATQAAIRAGYSEKTAQQIGAQNLLKLVVAEFIAELKAKRSEEIRIDAAWVLKSAKRVFDRCMQDEPVMVQGEPTGEYQFKEAGANKALEIIGRHVDVQAFLEKTEVKNVTEEMTDEDLDARIKALSAS